MCMSTWIVNVVVNVAVTGIRTVMSPSLIHWKFGPKQILENCQQNAHKLAAIQEFPRHA